jgi:hypothetical protein
VPYGALFLREIAASAEPSWSLVRESSKACKGVDLHITLAQAYRQASQAMVLLHGRSVRSI